MPQRHLALRRFACEVLLRNERTVRRWLAGDSPIPREVVNFLDRSNHPLADPRD